MALRALVLHLARAERAVRAELATADIALSGSGIGRGADLADPLAKLRRRRNVLGELPRRHLAIGQRARDGPVDAELRVDAGLREALLGNVRADDIVHIGTDH